jgi:hypothetical protein
MGSRCQTYTDRNDDLSAPPSISKAQLSLATTFPCQNAITPTWRNGGNRVIWQWEGVSYLKRVGHADCMNEEEACKYQNLEPSPATTVQMSGNDAPRDCFQLVIYIFESVRVRPLEGSMVGLPSFDRRSINRGSI